MNFIFLLFISCLRMSENNPVDIVYVGETTVYEPQEDEQFDENWDYCARPWEEISSISSHLPQRQGVSSDELELAEEIAGELLADPTVALVYWREEGDTERYIVKTAHQNTYFERNPDLQAQIDVNTRWIWNEELDLLQDPMAFLDLQAELDLGRNPNSAELYEFGYSSQDERLSFVETEDASWPFLADRISQVFDGEHAPDMAYTLAPHSRGGVGAHGGLTIFQSRAPLVMFGPGIKSGAIVDAVRHIDVAPTLAALMGMETIEGIYGPTMHKSTGMFLRWQDGNVLDEVLDDCAYGKAKNVVVFILDGLNNAEFYAAIQRGDLPNISRIYNDQSAYWTGGAIVGWPSFSMPGHVSLHTGTYQGHHGMYCNQFWDRGKSEIAPTDGSLADLLAPGNEAKARETFASYMSEDVETMFEAVHRNFPDEETGSINELTFRGASWCRITEGIEDTGQDSTEESHFEGIRRNIAQTESLIPSIEEREATAVFQYQAADSLAVFSARQMQEEIGVPKYLAISFYLTDAAGQYYGPHSDEMRVKLKETDLRFGEILDIYERHRAFEDTVFVLTADHGMEMQDPTRIHTPLRIFADRNSRSIMRMIYLNTLETSD
jgi:phosphonoacetate hydrolase